MPYSTVSFRMTLSELGWLSIIFNDMKRRAVSFLQLSFLWNKKVDDVVYRCGITFWSPWHGRGRHVVSSHTVILKGSTRPAASDRIFTWAMYSSWLRRLSRGTTRRITTITTRCSVLPAKVADTTPRSSISLYLALQDGQQSVDLVTSVCSFFGEY